MLSKHISILQDLLKELLDLSISETEFKKKYKPALESYEKYISDRPYWPIKDLVSMTGSDLIKYSSQALERLPKEELDRSTRAWIEDNLVVEDEFNFQIFEKSHQLYKTNIEGESFLLSALNGTIKPMLFSYPHLLSTLKYLEKNELATWAVCTEPDNAFAVVESLWSLGSVYEEPSQLSRIEQIRGDTVQWGNCYQMLLPKSKKWMLLNYYYFTGFEISLHGDSEFIDRVLSHNNSSHSAN